MYEEALRNAIHDHQKKLEELENEKLKVQYELDALLAVWNEVTPAVPQISTTSCAAEEIIETRNEEGDIVRRSTVGLTPTNKEKTNV